eukprot:766826-Hanusia_phi.AAC.1
MAAYYLFSHCTAVQDTSSQDFPLVEEVCPQPNALGRIVDLMEMAGIEDSRSESEGGTRGDSGGVGAGETKRKELTCDWKGSRSISTSTR